jgi:hypothetical protein
MSPIRRPKESREQPFSEQGKHVISWLVILTLAAALARATFGDAVNQAVEIGVRYYNTLPNAVSSLPVADNQ